MWSEMWAVRLEEVTKRYRTGGPGAGFDSLGRVISGVPRRVAQRLHRDRPSVVSPRGKLALEGVNLEVAEAEPFALIGSNGAGKSTALRIISRISPPTSGTVRVRGRVGALIEVTSGVHFELTGRENIWLYGGIIGIPRAEIRRRFDEIVDFSGLAHSLDTQVKYYSSGMQLRLGFSIASHLEPDVFVVDEALSVGDASFQSRCVERMTKLTLQGTTLLFVSHHLPSVEALCTRAALLKGGRIVDEGDVKPVLASYLASVEEERFDSSRGDPQTAPLRVIGASCHSEDGDERTRFRQGESIQIRLRFESDTPVERPHVVVGITDGRPEMLVECSMLDDDQAPQSVPSQWECRLKIPELPLRPRLYQVWCNVYASNRAGRMTHWMQVAAFRMTGDADSGAQVHTNSAPVMVAHEWEVRS
jgi:ABC-type polysaccharide/polyol phosphate transport system ATPase subunit